MEKEAALAIFEEIAALRVVGCDEETEQRWMEPPFHVRLDAGSVEGLDYSQEGTPYCRRRTWRVFVTWSGTSWASDDLNSDWEDVMKIATKHKAIVRPENSGLVIG